MKPKFELGTIVMTRAINDEVADCDRMAKVVIDALKRHADGDWGDLYESDKRANDDAVLNGDRILSAYKTGRTDDEKIWIITEHDRSVTTVLFPYEY